MFRNIVISAFGAGLAVCVAISLVQAFTTAPLILHAEEFEGAAALHDHPSAVAGETTSAAAPTHEAEEWAPANGVERVFFTVLANFVVGVAVALMILAAMMLKGEPIDLWRGLLWGLGGFVAVSLLPSLGLPPELPGTPAAEIFSRQVWWLGTAAASAVGIALLVFGRGWPWQLGGFVLLVAPHLIGAPEPPSHEVSYPRALAGEFVVASMVVSALLWTLAGAAGGWLHQRLAGRGT
jgi:cobalt transporter subunit CbtA